MVHYVGMRASVLFPHTEAVPAKAHGALPGIKLLTERTGLSPVVG